ncbi:MAG: hypothetical protein IGS39_14525 [Calothrix sp. C42_A2020_038]|nr:hypothetical protein [Calothrix sp. C42_A2020_038]
MQTQYSHSSPRVIFKIRTRSQAPKAEASLRDIIFHNSSRTGIVEITDGRIHLSVISTCKSLTLATAHRSICVG